VDDLLFNSGYLRDALAQQGNRMLEPMLDAALRELDAAGARTATPTKLPPSQRAFIDNDATHKTYATASPRSSSPATGVPALAVVATVRPKRQSERERPFVEKRHSGWLHRRLPPGMRERALRRREGYV